MDQNLSVIIMAAGKGTRMNDPEMAKVMYPVNGKPMVEHVVNLASGLNSSRIIMIVGWKKDSIIQHFEGSGMPLEFVEQNPQLGTGHAAMQAERALTGFRGDVLVLSGDVPLLSETTARELIAFHRTSNASATVLTADLDDPLGYGRVIRGADGGVVRIVEHKDATEKERRIQEINSGIYVFKSGALFQGLRHITPSNAQKEYYLTDVFDYFWGNKLPVSAVKTNRVLEIQGINTPAQLEAARQAMEAGYS